MMSPLLFYEEITMKLGKAIEMFRLLCPNPRTDAELVGWIAELDGMVIRDIFEAREGNPAVGWEPYTGEDMDRLLLIPAPYDSVYMDWLKSKVDYWQEESGYSNSYKAFNNSYMSFGDYWRRTHRQAERKKWQLFGRGC